MGTADAALWRGLDAAQVSKLKADAGPSTTRRADARRFAQDDNTKADADPSTSDRVWHAILRSG